MSEVHTRSAVIESDYSPENYANKEMEVEFTMPSIQIMSVRQHKPTSWLSRLMESTRARIFTLKKEWRLKVKRIDFKPELNGTIVIPETEIVEGKERHVTFDGASIPIPWVLSFLTLGIMRPLGVLLTASIIHDYAFKFGHLKVVREGSTMIEEVPLERHEADRLFRELILCINRLPFVAWFAWSGVRLGWLFLVKYNGKLFGDKPPIRVLLVLIALLTIIIKGIFDDPKLSFTEVLLSTASGILVTYFFAYLVVALWMKFFSPPQYD